jgi:hypothetical protein
LIERASAFGALDPPRILSSVTRIIRFLHALDPSRVILPKPIDASATMPSQEPDRSAEAIRRVLPELVHAGVATATTECVVAGQRTIEVARVRITDAGRRALAKSQS